MILGDLMLDAIAFVILCWAGAIIFLPLAQWIDYKSDCKKYGKEEADDIWRRMR